MNKSGKYLFALEDWVMDQVQEAVGKLKISGQPLTIKAICEETGIYNQELYKYDRVKTFLGGLVHYKSTPLRMQDPLHEEQLLEKTQQAVLELTQAGKPITHLAVSSLIGIPSRDIILYPRVKKLLGHFVDYAQQQQRYTKECEQALLEKVRTGIIDLIDDHQPVTYNAISQKIGISSSVWRYYAQVREFVEQNLDSRYLLTMKEREQREEVLISRVEETLSQLETAGKTVTFASVRKLLGVNATTLKTYPRVNALIEQHKSSPRFRGGRARRSEEEVMSEVQRIISLFIERNASINSAAIAREMEGISAQTLKTYPKVRMLVDEYLQSQHLYQLQQFALREEHLLCMTEAAMAELEALGKPFSQRELCEKMGKSRSTLRTYPRVKALLEQKVARHHTYLRRRRQPEEEELLQRVKEAIIDLTDCGEHITPYKIAPKVKLSPEVLMQYPQVVLLLKQSGYKKRNPILESEEELLDLMRDAIHRCSTSGKQITQNALSSMAGVKRSSLSRYPAVKALLMQAANEDQQQQREMRYQKHEEELTQQVVNAIQQLRDSGMRVSVRAVEKKVNVPYASLYYYSKVKAILESAIAEQLPIRKLEQD